ncbi:hypothetical protein DYU11_30185 [Fibrisoma montanum]|uniref:ABC transporter substrate-binding protein n=1 Tax=Fibrisoma montanum TaxID=2305895 RepID=A0A418LXM7_9BACT|nr:ABC transporter substrate binding protein [Fibrisoma montanum]RIV17978.1 hypothetical protein DYU11_30185 [Fibrisoma montanum]
MWYKAFLLGILMMSLKPAKLLKPKEVYQVLYINSYHAGYGSSDSVMAGIRQTLAASDNVALNVCFMDTKRHPDLATAKAQAIKQQIDYLKPDLVIASDDDAVREVVVPYLKNSSIPVVFCGVNWSAKAYGLPVANVTGMLEVVPIRETLETMKRCYPQARKLVILSENSPAEQKNTQVLDTLYRALGFSPEYALVDDFNAWKQAFRDVNQTADLIYLSTNGSIRGWQNEEVRAFVAQTIRRPVITCDDFMMPYAVYGQTKVAREQGEWAARTALKILQGAKPASFPLTRNLQSVCWFNPTLAERIQFKPDTKQLQSCRKLL